MQRPLGETLAREAREARGALAALVPPGRVVEVSAAAPRGRLTLAVQFVLDAQRRGGDSQEQPVVQQPTWPAPVQVQPGVVQQPMMPQQPAAASLEQRVVWAEQRIARLEQQTVALSQESQTQRQQLAQTQMEQIGRAHV